MKAFVHINVYKYYFFFFDQTVLLCDGIEEHSYSLIAGTSYVPNTYSAFDYLYSK